MSVEALKTRSRKPHIAAARKQAMQELLDYKEGALSLAMIGKYLNVGKTAVAQFKKRSEENVHYLSERFSADEYVRHLKRISGMSLHYEIANKIDCTAGEALYIATLAEQYPKFMSRSSLIIALTEGMRHFPGASEEVDEETIRPFRSRLRRKVSRRALPDPFEFCKPDGERLSQPFAQWMHYKFGAPVVYLKATA